MRAAEATAGDFEWEDAGGSYIRGVSETVELFRLVGPVGGGG